MSPHDYKKALTVLARKDELKLFKRLHGHHAGKWGKAASYKRDGVHEQVEAHADKEQLMQDALTPEKKASLDGMLDEHYGQPWNLSAIELGLAK